MKKLLAILLCICLLAGFLPVTAYAAMNVLVIGGEGFTEEELTDDLSGTGWNWNASSEKLT